MLSEYVSNYSREKLFILMKNVKLRTKTRLTYQRRDLFMRIATTVIKT